MTILKLFNNGRHAIIETSQFDDLNPKTYLVRKVVEVRKEPIVTVEGELLEIEIEEAPRSLKKGLRSFQK